MENNVGQKNPFQLKMFHNKLPLVTVESPVGLACKTFPTILALMDKFPLVFLELTQRARIKQNAETFFKELEHPEKLIIISNSPEKILCSTYDVPVLPAFQSALLRLKHKNGLIKASNQIANLPIMKQTAIECLEVLNDTTISFDALEKYLKNEPKICENILKICNTMPKNIGNPVKDISKAIQLMGIEGIRQIIIESAFMILTRIFVNQSDLLTHMRKCSVLAGVLGKKFSENIHVFWQMRSAALLHDLGSLLMCHYNPSEASRCQTLAVSKKITTIEAENTLMGINHQEAGLMMAKLMHLPDYLLPSIGHHHDQYINNDDYLLLSVIAANGFMNNIMEKKGYTPYETCLKNLESIRLKKYEEKRAKEKERMLSKLAPNDIEGRQRVEDIFNPPPVKLEEGEEALPDFRQGPRKGEFDIIDIEFIFKEKVLSVAKFGYKLQEF